MYFMFFSTSTLHFLTREMAPMLIPMICDAYGYTLAQRGCASLVEGPHRAPHPRVPLTVVPSV